MKIHEIIREDAIGTGTSLVTVASALGLNPKTPWLQKLVTYAPGSVSLLANVVAGNGATAALDALEVSLGNANLLPAEAKQAVNTFSALRSAHGLATGGSALAAGAAPLAALGVAAQQASSADMTKPGANVFASTARAGKTFGDWANKVSGRDDKYAQMRAAQRAELQAK